jgi:hypothetical protein
MPSNSNLIKNIKPNFFKRTKNRKKRKKKKEKESGGGGLAREPLLEKSFATPEKVITPNKYYTY